MTGGKVGGLLCLFFFLELENYTIISRYEMTDSEVVGECSLYFTHLGMLQNNNNRRGLVVQGSMMGPDEMWG